MACWLLYRVGWLQDRRIEQRAFPLERRRSMRAAHIRAGRAAEQAREASDDLIEALGKERAAAFREFIRRRREFNE